MKREIMLLSECVLTALVTKLKLFIMYYYVYCYLDPQMEKFGKYVIIN